MLTRDALYTHIFMFHSNADVKQHYNCSLGQLLGVRGMGRGRQTLLDVIRRNEFKALAVRALR